MMTITSSMMMMMLCLVDPVGAEVVQFGPAALFLIRGMGMSVRLRRWWESKVSLCEQRAFSVPPRS